MAGFNSAICAGGILALRRTLEITCPIIGFARLYAGQIIAMPC
jgi:hypothetical protein